MKPWCEQLANQTGELMHILTVVSDWLGVIIGEACYCIPQVLLLALWRGGPGWERGARREEERSSSLREASVLSNAALAVLFKDEFVPPFPTGQWKKCSVSVFRSCFIWFNQYFCFRVLTSCSEPCLTTENWKTSHQLLLCGWAVMGERTRCLPTTAWNLCPPYQKRENLGIKSSPYSLALKKVRCLNFLSISLFFFQDFVAHYAFESIICKWDCGISLLQPVWVLEKMQEVWSVCSVSCSFPLPWVAWRWSAQEEKLNESLRKASTWYLSRLLYFSTTLINVSDSCISCSLPFC